jgi:GH35 family endo-1,4-beta-xylanase
MNWVFHRLMPPAFLPLAAALLTGCPDMYTEASGSPEFDSTGIDGDDIEGQVAEGYEGLPLKVIVPEKAGRRPIPLSTVGGKGYGDLLFHTGNGKVFDRDEAWRKAAWARIENSRKGNVKVLVKDASGNPVSGAAVNIAMYEHEFQWGTAVNDKIHTASADRAKYRAAASALFNGAVLENQHKWVFFESAPAETENQFNAAASLGLKHQRGHTLVWDRPFNSGWESNSAIPQDLYNFLQANNRTALDNRIKNHILAITAAYKNRVEDWDVVNELLENHAIRDKYGNGVLNQWFDWARQGAGAGTKLFINETGLLGLATQAANSAARAAQFRTVLDYMRDNDVNFDGIGIQSHFTSYGLSPTDFYNRVSPEDFYHLMDSFKTYGKTLKVTEFDMGLDISSANRNYEAGFTRDILIAAFSQENVSGFLMWGFFSGAHWNANAPVFNTDWSLKESGKQYIDLVYNKWRTRLKGTTDADGAFRARAYFGDYDVSISAGGKTKTIEARWYKGQNNTTVVVLD